MAKEVLEIMQRCNEDLSKANKEDDMRARNLWMMMKPLEEKRIQDNKRAKYGNVAERKAYGIMHNFFMALLPAIAPGEASRGGTRGSKIDLVFFCGIWYPDIIVDIRHSHPAHLGATDALAPFGTDVEAMAKALQCLITLNFGSHS